MPIDWLRIQFQFLATDANKSYWRCPSEDVAGDIVQLRAELPTYPKYDLHDCGGSILAIFHSDTIPGWIEALNIGATIDRISDTIIAEGKTTNRD